MNRSHCNTLQHTAKHCNTLQHTATSAIATATKATMNKSHCYTLKHTAIHCKTATATTATMNESCDMSLDIPPAVFVFVLPHIWMSQETHMNESHCNILQYQNESCDMSRDIPPAIILYYICNLVLHCLILHMCDMTHSHVCHDSFICVTWLIHMCAMTHYFVLYL